MKKHILVEIDIDTNELGKSNLIGVDPEHFKIQVRQDVVQGFGEAQYSPVITTAHELGHLIGYVFGLPAASQEPRELFPSGKLVLRTAENNMRVLASENEAWDIAELMMRTTAYRSKAVGSYMRMPAINLSDYDIDPPSTSTKVPLQPDIEPAILTYGGTHERFWGLQRLWKRNSKQRTERTV